MQMYAIANMPCSQQKTEVHQDPTINLVAFHKKNVNYGGLFSLTDLFV